MLAASVPAKLPKLPLPWIAAARNCWGGPSASLTPGSLGSKLALGSKPGGCECMLKVLGVTPTPAAGTKPVLFGWLKPLVREGMNPFGRLCS